MGREGFEPSISAHLGCVWLPPSCPRHDLGAHFACSPEPIPTLDPQREAVERIRPLRTPRRHLTRDHPLPRALHRDQVERHPTPERRRPRLGRRLDERRPDLDGRTSARARRGLSHASDGTGLPATAALPPDLPWAGARATSGSAHPRRRHARAHRAARARHQAGQGRPRRLRASVRRGWSRSRCTQPRAPGRDGRARASRERRRSTSARRSLTVARSPLASSSSHTPCGRPRAGAFRSSASSRRFNSRSFAFA